MQAIDTTKLEVLSKAEAIQPPAVYGEDLQIASLVRRVRKLIKGAEKAPDEIIWRACQIATMHKLDIFSGDIWIYQAGGDEDEAGGWIVDIGIAAWRRAAQRQARYVQHFAEIPPDEVRSLIGENYTNEDIGFICTLTRLDDAERCIKLGIPYTPTVARGFWRKQARYSKKQRSWLPDMVANTETRVDKAQKRAEKKALKIAFSLDYPEERVINTDEKTIIDTHWSVASAERDQALPANNTPKTQVEPDGDQLWA